MNDRGTRAALIALGTAGMVFGSVQLLERKDELVSVAVWFTVPPIVSDLVLLPLIAAVGAALTARLRPSVRLPAQVALAVIGVLTLLAVPFLGGFGRRPDNPSLLDRNYLLGWASYVGAVVVVAVVWGVLRARRPSQDGPGPSPG